MLSELEYNTNAALLLLCAYLQGRQAEMFWPDDNMWYLIEIHRVNVIDKSATIVYRWVSVGGSSCLHSWGAALCALWQHSMYKAPAASVELLESCGGEELGHFVAKRQNAACSVFVCHVCCYKMLFRVLVYGWRSACGHNGASRLQSTCRAIHSD